LCSFYQRALYIIKEVISTGITDQSSVPSIARGQERNKEGIRSAVIVIFNVKNY